MSRLLEDLHPDFRWRVEAWKRDIEDESDWDLTVFTTLRGANDQRLEKAAGKSKAEPWESAHQYCLGVDVVPVYKGKAIWNTPLDADESIPVSVFGRLRWSWIAGKAALYGIDYPASRDAWMRKVDPYHFQHADFRVIGARTLLHRIRETREMIWPWTSPGWHAPSLKPADLAVKAAWEQ
jgi:hypothetical protein